MLSIERVKQLLHDPSLSDKEAEEIREHMRALVEIIFEQWKVGRGLKQENSGTTESNN